MLEVADTRSNSLLTAMALPNRFHTVRADYVVVNDEVLFPDQIFPTTFAHETLVMIILVLDREFLLIDGYRLFASIAFGGILVVAVLTQESSLVHCAGLLMKFVVTFDAAIVLLVPVLLGRLSELA